MPLIVVGGIRLGIVTPTQAAVVAAVHAMLVGFPVYRELAPAGLYRTFPAAAKTSAVVMSLIAPAGISARLIAQADLSERFGTLLEPFQANPTLFLLIATALVFALGTALDVGPTVLIPTPIRMPLVGEAGIDPVRLGVVVHHGRRDRPHHAADRHRSRRRVRR